MMKKILGILGGMGPEATAYFYQAVIKRTAADADQNHIRTLIWSDPTIPPRTDAILGTGPSPWPSLRAGIRILEKGGAGLLAMPCVTAHFWAPRIRGTARVPFIDLLEETRSFVRVHHSGLRRIGLVASSGTVASGLWTKAFAADGIEVLAPAPAEQERVMAAIVGPGGIKAGRTSGRPRTTIVAQARRLASRGAEAIIAGCTEVPLVLRPGDLPVPLIEPMDIGARACVRRAGYPLREDDPLLPGGDGHEKALLGPVGGARPGRPDRPGRRSGRL
jgi:aspartate racemase